MPFPLANVELTHTFNIWRTRTNDIIANLSGINDSANSVNANTITSAVITITSTLTAANTSMSGIVTTSGANTNILGVKFLSTSNTVFLGSNNYFEGILTANGANTNITGGVLYISSNTNIIGSWLRGVNLEASANLMVGTTNVADAFIAATGDALAFSIALG